MAVRPVVLLGNTTDVTCRKRMGRREMYKEHKALVLHDQWQRYSVDWKSVIMNVPQTAFRPLSN